MRGSVGIGGLGVWLMRCQFLKKMWGCLQDPKCSR